MADIDGTVAPGWDGVRAAFEANFEAGREVGAAFSAYHRGEKVVDLWGGVADQTSGRPWTEDTMALVFSTTKGMTAICANKLIQEGRLDPEAPVAEYWPSFAKQGKDAVPVKFLLSHRVGLPWVEGRMTREEMLRWDPVVEALEITAPVWEPGTEHGYHATTYGWLVGELIRRITGQSVGTYLRSTIAEPFGLDVWIGLPAEEEPRVAPLVDMFPAGMTLDTLLDEGGESEPNPMAEAIAAFIGPDTELGKALFAPGFAIRSFADFNDPEVHAGEIPAANGICTARSLAKLYAGCVSEIERADGTRARILTEEQTDAAIVQQTEGANRILMGLDIQFGLGFMLHSSLVAIGGPRGFGHFGAGGSMGWADPDAELAVGYVMNRMDLGLTGDTRTFDLVNACYAALG